MATLEFCSKHNMVAYLEKTYGNKEFHQIMDFLTRSSIYYALTISPIVSTLFVEQFWMTAKSRTVNNISYIDATVAGKHVTISEASIRSDLLFDDADGIDSLTNQALFDHIQLMGNQLKDVHVPLYHFPVPTLTKKVLIFMVKKGKNFSGKITPLFDSMLVHNTEDEGDASERPSNSPPIPSPPHPKGSGGNHGGKSSNNASLSGNEDGLTLQSVYDLCVSLCKQVTAQAKEIKDLKAQVKKLKKGVKPLITHHKAWMKTRLARKTSLKKKGVHKEYVSKQGRKFVKTFKGKPYVHKDLAFDDLDDFVNVDDTLDYMETEDVQDERRNEGTDKGNEGTDKQDGGTDSTKVSTDRQGEGTADQNEGKSVTQTAPTPTPTTPTPTTPTPTFFGDDETIAQVLIIMSQNKEKLTEKEKGIDPKDKGKKRIKEEDESDTELEGITEAKKKFKQLANNEEVARKVQEEVEAEEEKKRLDEEEVTKATLSNEYDFIQARLDADKILTEKLQEEEIDHVGGKKHSELKTKTFEEIQVLYERLKRQDQNFVAIGSAEDERQIKELNKDPKKKRLKKRVFNETPREEDTARVPAEQEVIEQDSEIMETKSFIARLHKVSSPDGNYLVVYRVNGHFRAFNYLMEVLHIFDRHDLFHLYDLVMKQYSEITPEDIELILWGDLKIMMESSTEENDQGDFWNNQQEWEIVRWRLYEACGVCILELKDGTAIFMLFERRYPLSKKLLQQIIDLGLKVEEESTAALQLSKNKVLVTETYVWDEEEVSFDDEQMVQAKMLMALAEVEQLVGKNLTRNSEWMTSS
ncbi:hypothetical protein Tco_0205983 [Tanacetum coccineum]